MIYFFYEQLSYYDYYGLRAQTGKVIKINSEKNIKLSEALRVKVIPTLMIYKSGEMMWRQSGEQDANTLINLINEFI